MAKDYGTKQIKLGRGRPTKEETIVRSTLESWLEIEEMVGKDALEAYTVLRDIMLAKDSTPVQKERTANKILELHAKFYKTRVKSLDSVDEDMEEEEETSVVFQWKQA